MAKPIVLPIWDTTDVNTTEPDATHKAEGWLAPGGVPEKPPFEYFNFWQKNVYDWLKEINATGILVWDVATEYGINSYVVGSDGDIYKGLTAANTGNDPVGDPVNWKNVITKYVASSYTQDGEVATGTTVLPFDDTAKPQSAEGDEYLSLAHTAEDAANLLRVDVVLNYAHQSAGEFGLALFKGAAADALSAAWDREDVSHAVHQLVTTFWVVAGSVAAETYKVRAGSSAAGTTTINGSNGARIGAGVMFSSMTITEYKP